VLKRSPLVGRKEELAQLREALARCRAGEGGVVLISGDSGIGKSRLVAEALSGWDGCVLRTAAGVEPLPDHIASGQPTVLVLEDLHLAGADALGMLPAAAATAQGTGLLVLGTYDSNGLPRTHPLRAVRAELRRTGCFQEVVLKQLTIAETGEMATALLGAPLSPEQAAALHKRADGLPFFVEELVLAYAEAEASDPDRRGIGFAPDNVRPLPDSIVDAVQARTHGVREAHMEAVELAAVLGVSVDLPVLSELVAPEEVDELLESGLLREQEADVATFRHALVRDSIYGTIPWARRRAHHRRVAERLTARGGAPGNIAEHWLAAREHDVARPLLIAAAQESCSVHAYRDAAHLARRALAIWPGDTDPEGRVTTLEKLAECAERGGELLAAAEAWAQVGDVRAAEGDHEAAGLARRRFANAAELLGDFPLALSARRAAAEAFGTAGARAEAATEHMALAELLKSAADLGSALDHAVAARADAEATGRKDLVARALTVEGSTRAAMGDGRRGIELARSGLDLAFAEQLTDVAGLSYYELAEALLYAADYPASADAYASAFDFCREHSASELGQACLACMSVAVRFQGDWDRALAICADVLSDPESPEEIRMVAVEESGLISALRGDHRKARGPLRRAAAFGRSHEVFGIEVGASWGLVVVAVLEGDPGADSAAAKLLDRCIEKQEWNFALPALRWLATHAGKAGDREHLAQCHRLLGTAATQNSSPKVLSALAHAGGELMLADSEPAQAVSQFARSAELLHAVSSPYDQGLTQLRWGVALEAAGDRPAAVDMLTRAYRTARQLGAKPLVRECATSLSSMGEQVERRLGRLAARTLEPGGLTRRETEVLQLLSEGGSNRQIAQQLFLSTRTVDMHVRNVLAKLGCGSRVAAVRRAVDLGLVQQKAKVRH
jgi:DNA-binding NarL/FixJ family response regulator